MMPEPWEIHVDRSRRERGALVVRAVLRCGTLDIHPDARLRVECPDDRAAYVQGALAAAHSAHLIGAAPGIVDTELWAAALVHCLVAEAAAAAHQVDAQAAVAADTETTSKRTQAQDLVAIGGSTELFHDAAGDAYSSLDVDGHREVWPIRSTGFKEWLAGCYFENREGKTPAKQAIEDALTHLEGHARRRGEEREVYVRLAQDRSDRIYLDLCDTMWRAVEVRPGGWRIVDRSEVMFVRRRAMLPLPVPTRGGEIATLKAHLNRKMDERTWRLIVAYTVDLFRPRGAHPILGVSGEQGSIKTGLLRRIRSIVDPNVAAVRRPPKEDRDIAIACRNAYVIAYQNLSHISSDLADALCTVATGGAFGTRELYGNTEETLFAYLRPVMFDGIPDLLDTGDFADRAVRITLPKVNDGEFLSDEEADAAFERDLPGILGAFLDAVAGALARLADVHIHAPRMASFARWVVAAEPVLPWEPLADGSSQFMADYRANRAEGARSVLDGSHVAAAVFDLLARHREGWSGAVSTLLATLAEIVPDPVKRQRTWPTSPKALSNTLRRLAPAFRSDGVVIEFLGAAGHDRRKAVRIGRQAEGGNGTQGPQDAPKVGDEGDKPADYGEDHQAVGGARAGATFAPSSPPADDADHSGPQALKNGPQPKRPSNKRLDLSTHRADHVANASTVTGSSATDRSSADPPPTSPCPGCGGLRFWLPMMLPDWRCQTCRPPAHPNLVRQEVEVGASE